MTIDQTAKVGVICKPRRTVPSFAEIDRRRVKASISVAALERAAGTDRKTWASARRGLPVLDRTMLRYAAALDQLIAGGEAKRSAPLIAAFVRAAEVLLLAEIGKKRKLIEVLSFAANRAGGRRRRAAVLYAPRIKSLAIYLAAVELEVSNADLARAGFGTRQNVKQIRGDIEDLRDNKLVDALLDRCTARVRGA